MTKRRADLKTEIDFCRWRDLPGGPYADPMRWHNRPSYMLRDVAEDAERQAFLLQLNHGLLGDAFDD